MHMHESQTHIQYFIPSVSIREKYYKFYICLNKMNSFKLKLESGLTDENWIKGYFFYINKVSNNTKSVERCEWM